MRAGAGIDVLTACMHEGGVRRPSNIIICVLRCV
jgi:hypothetical protein